MSDIINLDDRRPHLSGEAKCLSCKHKWVAVSPIDINCGLECPECGLMKGEFIGEFAPDDVAWSCNCENNLFCLCRSYFMSCLWR